MQSLWWFRTKEGVLSFSFFFYVLFLYLLCFWFCSCWIDLHMCCRQSSGLHAYTHMWYIYQQDPPWQSACIPANKTSLLKMWLISMSHYKQTKNPVSNSAYPEKGMLRSDASIWERGLCSWLLVASRFSTGENLVLHGVVFQLWKHTHRVQWLCPKYVLSAYFDDESIRVVKSIFGFLMIQNRNNSTDHKEKIFLKIDIFTS